MLTERQIKADLEKAREYASELEEEAGRLSSLANRSLEGVFDELRVAWKGENAEKYLRKGEELKADIANTAKALKNIAATIRSNAQNTYTAEMENLRIYQEKQRELAKQAVNEVSSQMGSSGGGHSSGIGYSSDVEYSSGGGRRG